ncbi:proline racemase family protein [Neobacillus cucumis]|uniref:proline racemase family protein n=1 Tax=Neobacillus cucumis TaxID=1740721 RepID=UPI0018DFF2F7|nr:proline racemase family protein [Neobacillus cucumis]MBI0577182.1 proline racemase family protein [Neobacillus cucumis]
MKFTKHFSTVDMHTGGEPFRIITSGVPFLKGDTILEKRAYFKKYHDEVRQVLMFEPRGHHGMYGCVITPPEREDSDFGILFMHNEGLSTMCGHGTIAAVTYAIESGLVAATGEETQVVIDSPAGKLTAYAQCEGTKVKSVSFENVPSFVFYENSPVVVDGKNYTVDIAYGGAFYAIVDAKEFGQKVDIDHLAALQKIGMEIKRELESSIEVVHPFEKDINGIYGVIFTDEPKLEDSDSRNVTIFADGQVDRSPCGSGTGARVALLKQKSLLQKGQQFVHESIVNSQFVAEIIEETEFGPYSAVIPKITGNAFITGMHQFVVDPTDPLRGGFLIG